MDYSLLVGIKKIPPKSDDDESIPLIPEKGKTREMKNEIIPLKRGCYQGEDPVDKTNEKYYIGIIDCFTMYRCPQRVSNFFKGLIWDEECLSTVPPYYYARRFYDFVKTILIDDTEPTLLPN